MKPKRRWSRYRLAKPVTNEGLRKKFWKRKMDHLASIFIEHAGKKGDD